MANFKPDQNDYKNLTPFKMWLVNQINTWGCSNFPFLESDFDKLTNYSMMMKLMKAMNEVISNENKVEEDMTNLFNAFTELQNYINTYFDNLDVQEEVNNKLDEMVESGQFQEILEEYMTTKVDYFYIDENSTFTDIKNAFESAKAKIIEFKKGTYSLSNQIFLTSNTKVLLNGSTLNSTYSDTYGDNVIFLGYALNSDYRAYNGISNIEFKNGKINTAFALMHNTNITFNNIEFDNITSHALQIGGCKDIKIINCTFNGTIIDDVNGQNHELIQLERADYSSQPYLPEDSSSYDETGNFNILIDNCIFNKGNEVTTRNYVCIGHHGYSADYPYYNKNITVSNCEFEENTYSDISGPSFDNLDIFNNKFKQTNEIATTLQIRLRHTNKNIYIHDNIFEGRSGIQNVNVKQLENIHIFNNIFKMNNQDSPIISMNSVKDLFIHDNYFKNIGYHIYIAQSENLETSNVVIENNKFNINDLNSNRYGIALYGGSDIQIKNNYVMQNNSRHFIYVNGATNYLISKNEIINSTTTPQILNGISLDYSHVYNVYRNLFSGNGASSYAITNQSVSFAFNTFNRLDLRLHKTNDAAAITHVILEPYSVNDKLSKRAYEIPVIIDGSLEVATFTINEDGTFSFESTNNSIVLRDLTAYNII